MYTSLIPINKTVTALLKKVINIKIQKFEKVSLRTYSKG